MVVFAWILIVLGAGGIVKHLRIARNGVHATAMVAKIRRSAGYRNKYDNVYLSFQAEDGQHVTGRSDEALNAYAVGDMVDIIYLRDNPTKVYTSSGGAWGYIFVIAGLVLLFV